MNEDRNATTVTIETVLLKNIVRTELNIERRIPRLSDFLFDRANTFLIGDNFNAHPNFWEATQTLNKVVELSIPPSLTTKTP